MAKKILLGVALLILVFVVVVATRPAAFHTERSTTMRASPDGAFALVNDFHNWSKWSPWEKLDPAMTRTYSGPTSGVGASYSWESKSDKVGSGRMTIEKSEKGSLIVIKLEFLKPFPATNTATFSFGTTSEGTKVTWSMDGKNNFMAKAFQMFVDMDKLIGKDFDAGLAAMKVEAESSKEPTK